MAKITQCEDISERDKEMDDKKIIEIGNNNDRPEVLRLYLELDMKYVGDEELQILKKYGSMKQAISRDILVPADITLHALNYTILRMFGWQNGHLHNYSLPEKVFEELTENQFSTWSKMAGVYFRFPTEDYEDIYWDDDYKEGESIKSWMKRKYTGPYRYKGHGEHYLINQMEVQSMFSKCDEITVPEFDFKAEEQPKPYNVKLREATVDQVIHAFSDIMCHELIERLPLKDVLRVKNEAEADLAEVKKYIKTELSKIDIRGTIEEYRNKRFGSVKREKEFLEKYNIPTLPVAEQLHYSYDYGDGWEVLITCKNAYKINEVALWHDMEGKEADVSVDNLEEVIAKHRPICIEKDGIELVDDIGGIGGFCSMLQTIYECDMNDQDELDERNSTLEWAEMMGWTGRWIDPKQTL